MHCVIQFLSIIIRLIDIYGDDLIFHYYDIEIVI